MDGSGRRDKNFFSPRDEREKVRSQNIPVLPRGNTRSRYKRQLCNICVSQTLKTSRPAVSAPQADVVEAVENPVAQSDARTGVEPDAGIEAE